MSACISSFNPSSPTLFSTSFWFFAASGVGTGGAGEGIGGGTCSLGASALLVEDSPALFFCSDSTFALASFASCCLIVPHSTAFGGICGAVLSKLLAASIVI